MSSNNIAISVEELTKKYEVYDKPINRLKQSLYRGKKNFFREYKALDNISFKINQGETIGIVGKNGSGKSTLLQIIANTLNATSGDVLVNGKVAALLELGFIKNTEDAKLLGSATMQQKAGKAIADGVLDYINWLEKTK